MLSPRHRREERHFVAVLQRLAELAQFFVARAHQVLLGQHSILATFGQQRLAHVVQHPEVALQTLGINTQQLPVTGEIHDLDLHHASAL